MVKQRLKHGRHAGKGIGAHAANGFQRLPRIEPRQHGNAAALGYGAVQYAGVGKHMEHGQHAQNNIGHIPVKRVNGINLLRIGGKVGMGQHGALGHAGGAACILQQGQVCIGINCHRRWRINAKGAVPRGNIAARGHWRNLLAAQYFQGNPLGQRQHIAQAAYNQLLQGRCIQHFNRCGQQGCDIEGDQQSGAGIFHLMGQFLGTVEGREIDHDGTRHHGPVIGGNIDRDIGQEQADAVALANAHCLKAGGKTPRFVIQRGIGISAAQKFRQRRSWRCRRGGGEHRGQGLALYCHVPLAGVLVEFGRVTDIHVNLLAQCAVAGKGFATAEPNIPGIYASNYRRMHARADGRMQTGMHPGPRSGQRCMLMR